jgi:hypothetical protein
MKITEAQLRKGVRRMIREQLEPGTNEWEEQLGYDEGYEDGHEGLEHAGNNNEYVWGWEAGHRDAEAATTTEHDQYLADLDRLHTNMAADREMLKQKRKDPAYQQAMSNQYWDPERKNMYQGD